MLLWRRRMAVRLVHRCRAGLLSFRHQVGFSSCKQCGLFLRHGLPQADGYISALPRGDLVGQEGVALTDLRPAGTARIGAERVDVVTEGEYVSQGAPVRVVRSEGYRHVVMPVAR